MKAVTVPSPYGASSSSCHHYNNYRVVILMAKSKKSQPASSPIKGSEPAPPRITSNVKQNLQFLKLWKEFQKRKSSTPKPSTSYRRKKVEKEDLPEDTELYRDPTLSLYYVDVIFTGESCADAWIEKEVVALKEDGCPKVWVVTSDHIQQHAAHGAGAFIWSCKALVSEIKTSQQEVERALQELRPTSFQGRLLKHNLDSEVVDALKDLRKKLAENESKSR